jgi:hypothetical protein
MKKTNLIAITSVAIIFSMLKFASAAPIDDVRAANAGIHKISGRRLTLYTDLSGPEIDALPGVFEQAFPQWCKYFGISEKGDSPIFTGHGSAAPPTKIGTVPNWQMTGFLMKDKSRFARAGLLPDDLPPFEHGFSRGDRLWLNEQPSDYYRRHLLLHEGTHGFMNTVLGACGPPWYMESVAEYLATHRWHNGQLTLAYMPKNRDETPMWGRIRLIQDELARGRAMPLPKLIAVLPTDPQGTDFYAWCWAAATLLDLHPRYHERFRKLQSFVLAPDFNERFQKLFHDDWQELCEEWQVMTANLEYGYDVARSAIDFEKKKGSELLSGDSTRKNSSDPFYLKADRGWQNSGIRLEKGLRYRIAASGRYQVAREPKIWWCEPNGVSIRYYHGLPLGILLGAVRPDRPPADGVSALVHPTVIGLGTTLTPAESGMLFLKINDSAAELSDNAGELKVEVQRE